MPSNLGSRSRNNARRKADDDSAYVGASGLGRKRIASERLDLSTDRAKRKRIETNAFIAPGSTKRDDGDNKPSYMDFEALPPGILQRYLHHWGLVPPSSLMTSPSPILPSALLLQMASNGPEPTVTPANRPRREPKEPQNRQHYSSHRIEGDNIPVMADVDGVHQAYAAIAEQHFQRRPAVKEVEVLTNFLLSASRSHGQFT